MKKRYMIIALFLMIIVIIVAFGFSNDRELQKEVIQEATQMAQDIAKYDMTSEEIENLATTEIIEQTQEQEEIVSNEQETESEAFEEQGEIAYNGTTEYPNVSVGNYVGLTYYSQIDNRWSSHSYTSCGNYSQTIGTSGCGPTCASMVVTAIKGTITPPEMGDLFVRYGYRSSNNGTYFSAFRFVADTFNIGYEETYRLDDAVNLVRNNHYVIVSCANGLFTTGGHFIVIVGIDGNTLKIYDPYLYAGKFETSTRRGKVSVSGNTVYCSIDNFRNYANYQKFFAFKHDGNIQTNDIKPVVTNGYTRYVNAKIGLNIRNAPNGTIIGSYKYGTAITVLETSGNWSRTNLGWISSNYLATTIYNNYVPVKTTRYTTGTYRVNASILNVRYGAGINYKSKNYSQLSANARNQNKKLGNYYTNGYKKGVVCTVTKVSGSWGLTASGWICLDYCTKL